MSVQVYDVQLGDAGGIHLEIDVDVWQLEVETFRALRELINTVKFFGDDEGEPSSTPDPEFRPQVGDGPDDHKARVILYADECGSDAKAAKAFGIDDFRTIRQWRRELNGE